MSLKLRVNVSALWDEVRQYLCCGNKMPTRCNRWFLLQILFLAQHVSSTIMVPETCWASNKICNKNAVEIKCQLDASDDFIVVRISFCSRHLFLFVYLQRKGLKNVQTCLPFLYVVFLYTLHYVSVVGSTSSSGDWLPFAGWFNFFYILCKGRSVVSNCRIISL